MVKRNWHEDFYEYMNFIANHENYQGLSIEKKKDGSWKWIVANNSEMGKKRKVWIINKGKELGIKKQHKCYSKVMFKIHPTKEKPCQICGQVMSLRYIYPNKHFVNFLSEKFNYVPNTFDDISDINEHLRLEGLNENEIKSIYIEKLNFRIDPDDFTLKQLTQYIEEKCRNGNKKAFGPGAMSNPPDRFDGFHTYNRCCRSEQDTGRHKDNMKTYTKDRRAYENWSDGNINAANRFMRTSYFENLSADHIGPISLGFIHDPRYIEPMSLGDNSAKRDKLEWKDVLTLIELEEKYKISPVSWFAQEIWISLKDNIENINSDKNKLQKYRSALKKNITNYMEILWYITNKTNEDLGARFLIHYYIKPKMEYFKYDYKFNEFGEIIESRERHQTSATQKEFKRFKRISFESVEDFHQKSNRNIKALINEEIHSMIIMLIKNINNEPLSIRNKKLFENVIHKMQLHLINEFELN